MAQAQLRTQYSKQLLKECRISAQRPLLLKLIASPRQTFPHAAVPRHALCLLGEPMRALSLLMILAFSAAMPSLVGRLVKDGLIQKSIAFGRGSQVTLKGGAAVLWATFLLAVCLGGFAVMVFGAFKIWS